MIRWHKVRTIAAFELSSAVRRTGFLVITFGMPLFIAGYAAMVAVPAYYAAKRDRDQPAVFGVVDRPQLLQLAGRHRAAADGNRRGHAAAARGHGPERGRRSCAAAIELRVPAVRVRGRRRGRRWRQRDAARLFRPDRRLPAHRPCRVYGPGRHRRVGQRTPAPPSACLVREQLVRDRTDAGRRGPDHRAAAGRQALRGHEDRGDQGRGQRRVGGAGRRPAGVHRPVSDVGADDLRLPPPGHRHREGEQGRRGAARLGQPRRDPGRQAAGPRRRRAPPGRRCGCRCSSSPGSGRSRCCSRRTSTCRGGRSSSRCRSSCWRSCSSAA